ncbi:MAG: hypothetical protein GXY42_01795, partial [Desulfovibrionales bacterium]|nr:hypothetical protein [Desulfovibrionales bacterium]
QRTIRLGPAVDLPDEVHPVYGEDALALARATAAIDAAAHYIDDITVTCPLGLGAGLGDVVSVPVDGVAVIGQVESITWTATPDGTMEQAVIRRHVAIAPQQFVEITPPSVADDTGETDKTTGISGNVLTNDDTGLIVVAVNGLSSNVGVAVDGSNGGSFTIAADGAWTFSPDGDFALLEGSETADTSVTYHASDGTAEAVATLTVTVSAASAALWTPAQISGALWFDPDDEAHRSLVNADISSLTDVIGGTVTVSQGVSAYKPVILADALAGHDVAVFGGDDRLLGSTTAYGTNPVSVFSVWKTTDSSGTDIMAMLGASANNKGLGISRNTSASGYNVFVWNGPEPYIAGAVNTWTMHLGQRNASGVRVGLNGSLSTYTATTVSLDSGQIAVGIAANNIDGAVNGQLAALVIGDFSDADVDMLFGWAAHKYGLAASLPTDHPYKSTAPTL